jgi:hypothetical protein
MTGGHRFGPDHRLKTAAALSQLWDGCGIRRLRAGDGITDLPGRRLALHLMVQPDAAAAFLSDPTLRDQGLLSRLLLAAPESLAGQRVWQETPAELDGSMRRYTVVILGLLEREAATGNAAGNELAPKALDLSAKAKDAWVFFYDRVEAEMAEGRSLESLRDVAAKAAENAARIAGVLTVTEDPDASFIDATAMNSACELMAWYIAEALRLSGEHRLPQSLRNAVELLDWLHAKERNEIARREIMQLGPVCTRTKAAADAAVETLISHGHLVVVEGNTHKYGVIKERAQ